MIKVCIDTVRIENKPDKNGFKKINNRIAANPVTVTIDELLDLIVNKKLSWCPATFNDNKRCNDSFSEKTLFALDFDGGITWEDVLERSIKYNIPVLFAYETLSSINQSRFRVVFQNISTVQNIRVANAIQYALQTVFHEADKSCRDVSRIFLGGKKIIYRNDTATINFCDIIQRMTQYLMETDKAHYLRAIEYYSKSTGLIRKNGFIHIDISDSEIGDMDVSPIKIYIGNALISPDFCNVYFEKSAIKIRYNGDKIYTGENKRSGKRNLLRNTDFNSVKEKCRLFKEFCLGERWLYHQELFGLSTNVLRISSGEKEFFGALYHECNKDYYSYYENNWKFQITYMKAMDYNAMNCNSYCPYANECRHAKSLIETIKTCRNDIIKLSGSNSESYCDLNELEENLSQTFMDTINYPGKLIHIISSQTGSGKSKAYKDYIQNNTGKKFIIAAPTNALKREIHHDLLKLGVRAEVTLSLKEMTGIPEEIRRTIDYLYDIGAERAVSKYLRALVKKNNYDIAEIQQYLKKSDSIAAYEGHIVTTHARLLTFSAEQLKKYEIIVDEDIMRTLLQSSSIYIDDLDVIEEALTLPQSIQNRIQEIREFANNKQEYCKFSIVPESDIVNLYGEIFKEGIYINSNIAAFLKANCGYIHSDMNRVSFINIKKLHPSVKYIILSATPCLDLYKLIHPYSKISYHKCKHAEYAGKLNQYFKNPFSRNYIAKHPYLYDKIKSHFGKHVPIITFKKYKDSNIIPHFGQTEGFNGYQGKDIAVVGTPHVCEFIYKLIALSLGKQIDDKLQHQEVEYKNYRFWFMTYKDGFLRKIQFWYIESELEQAVGRSRLLRQDCTVVLFSNFPLQQATLIDDCTFLDETTEECETREDAEKSDYNDSFFE